MNQSLSDMEHPLSQFRYCPKCGSEHFKVHNEKSKQCADCGFIYYFNPSSATVALILNEKNELLVCRRAKAPAKGTLDLHGGYTQSRKNDLSVYATEHLRLFGIPGSYIGHVLPLQSKRYQPHRRYGRCS